MGLGKKSLYAKPLTSDESALQQSTGGVSGDYVHQLDDSALQARRHPRQPKPQAPGHKYRARAHDAPHHPNA